MINTKPGEGRGRAVEPKTSNPTLKAETIRQYWLGNLWEGEQLSFASDQPTVNVLPLRDTRIVASLDRKPHEAQKL